MKTFRNLKSGVRSLLNKPAIDRELDEELETYLEACAADKQRTGLTPDAARRQARIEVGSRNSVKHQVWSSRWEASVDSLFQDVRLSLRSLTKSPGFTLIALLSLALGIGANTAIFTLIHQVLLRDLPVQRPEELVTFGKSFGGGILGGIDLGTFDMFTWDFARQLEANPGPFEGVAAYSSFSPQASVRNSHVGSNAQNDDTVAAQVPASLVSGNYFVVLGATPLLGRTIDPSDARAKGSNPVVVVSERYWQQSMSSDPGVLDRTISINGNPYRVVGVMPASFHGIKQDLEPPALWVPDTMQQQIFIGPDMLAPRSFYFLQMFARRKASAMDKAGLQKAQLWLDQQVRAYIRAGEGAVVASDRQKEIERATVSLVPAAQGVSGVGQQFGGSLLILMVVVALVLLIACANLANFLVARAVTRQREIATRLALGSSRSRIVRQSLMEAMLLSLAGGALGLAVAFAATRALIAFVGRGVSNTVLSPLPHITVLLFTLCVSILTGILFGLAPALSAARTAASASLSSNSRAHTGSRSARIMPKLLVTTQVMVSLLLLVVAGLFLRTFRNLESQNFGFERTDLLLAHFDPQIAGYKPSQAAALNRSLMDRLESIPGVRSAALANSPPISPGKWQSEITVPSYTPAPKEDTSSVLNRVTGHYFETTGISIVAGRAITSQDSATSLKVAVVNESLARHFFPKGDAIGHSFSVQQSGVIGPWQIVGISRDTHSGNPRDADAPRMAYLPLVQIFGPDVDNAFAFTILLRTAADPAQSIAGLRRAVAELDPNLPLTQIETIQQQVDSMMSHEQLISTLTGIFSLLALLLAAIGLYGVMSYSVVRRTNEIGIRLALGAQTRAVLWMVLRESLLLLAVGLALGLPVTLAITHLVGSQFFGIQAYDPATFATAIAVVAAMTLFAAWLPARRAARVDPMIALRCD